MQRLDLAARVVIRDFDASDLTALCDYWFRSPVGFLESIGVDPARIRPERELIDTMQKKLAENRLLTTSKLNMLTVVVDGQTAGMVSVGELVEAESAVMHAHFWRPEYRGQGLGTYVYPRACRIFMERFDLGEVVFKTPRINAAAIRIKEKLGIPCVGEEVLDYPFMRPGIVASVYRVRRQDLERLEELSPRTGPR